MKFPSPLKTNNSIPRALSPSETAHIRSVECVSSCVDLLSLYSLLTLEFFPVQSQGPSPGGPSQGLTGDLGRDHSFSRALFSFITIKGLLKRMGHSKGVRDARSSCPVSLSSDSPVRAISHYLPHRRYWCSWVRAPSL